jgi:glycosyltransferase involved in cell wall biosynthesis
MNVFMGFDRLAPHFGPGTLGATLVAGLRRRGHRVTVFIEEPVEPGNQYVAAFRDVGAEVVAPGRLAAAAARWLRFEALLLAALLPLRIVLTLADAVVRRRPLTRAWRGVRGRLHGWLPAGALAAPLRWAQNTRLTREHRRRPADLLHMMSGVGSAFAWAPRHGVPIVYTENIVPSSEFGVDWWRDVIRHADRVGVTVSVCAAAEPAIRNVLHYRGPIVVAPSTIADPLANGAAPAPSASAATACVIGCAARLNAVKGLDLLLRALPRISAGAEQVQLWLAGDGPERAALESLAHELGVAAQVRFLGHCGAAAMAEFWGRIDIFALPSRWEGLPLVVLEAMAYAKPVVATAVDGIPEAVRDGETGVLVPVGHIEPLADALAALANDRDMRAAMGRAGRARFLAEFSADVALDRWLAAYDIVLSDRDPDSRLPSPVSRLQ